MSSPNDGPGVRFGDQRNHPPGSGRSHAYQEALSLVLAIEDTVFNLAVSQPARDRKLTVEGCRILARQFRDRVEARQVRAAALVGHSHACPFDLHTLLPVPEAILQLGPTHSQALAWLTANWGVSDRCVRSAFWQSPRPGGGCRAAIR
jgi:hypothetical protein